MNRELLFLCAAGCLLLNACATGGSADAYPALTSRRCDTATCVISVLKAPDAGGECQVSVDFPDVDVVRQRVTLVWRIDRAADEAGYAFANAGVLIDTPDPDREFEPVEFKNKKVVWHDRHEKTGKDFKYSVYALRNGVACRRLDPFIHN